MITTDSRQCGTSDPPLRGSLAAYSCLHSNAVTPMASEGSVEFGPAYLSPNPIQRWEAGHPYLARLFVAWWLFGWPAIGFLGASIGFQCFAVGFGALAAKYALSSRRRTADEDRHLRLVRYLSWPTWLPGGQPNPDLAASLPAETAPTSTRGPIGASPNPLQRLSVVSPFGSYLFAMAIMSAPLAVVGRAGGASIGLIAIALLFGTIVSAPIVARHPLWRMTRNERFDRDFVYLAWPKRFPGYRDHETLVSREHRRRASLSDGPQTSGE